MNLKEFLISNLDNRITNISAELATVGEEKEVLYKQILNYNEFIISDKYIKNTSLCSREDLTRLYKKQYTGENPKFSDTSLNEIRIVHKNRELILIYIKCFVVACVKEHRLTKKKEFLLLLQEHGDILHELISCMNDELSKELLVGDYLELGMGVGHLVVIEKKAVNNHLDKREGYKKRINWQESMKIKKSIEADNQVPFSKEDAPDGIPWIVTHENEYAPYIKFSRSSNLPHSLYYSFIPTNYCNVVGRSQNAFRESCSNVRDIIDCNDLGLRDKLFMIHKFDPMFYFKNRIIR